MITVIDLNAGGKAKPLKAPKKEKKELDEDDIAYREKLKAGTHFCPLYKSYLQEEQVVTLDSKTNPSFRRRKGKQGNGREGQRKRPTECRAARNQKVWEEVARTQPVGGRRFGVWRIKVLKFHLLG